VKLDMRTARQLSLACVMVLTACKLNITPVDRPAAAKQGDCEGAACASSAPPIDWSAPKPTYEAHLVVVDTAGEPVKGATIKVGDKTVVTDKSGAAVVGPLDAVEVATVNVEKEGATPQVTKATAFSSSRTTQEVVVAPLDVDKMVDVQKQTTADANGAHLDVPARALATEDGTRATMAHMQLTFISGSASRSLIPGDGSAVNDAGAPTAMGPLGGVLFTRFTDASNKPLNLAPGQSALLELPVAAELGAADGDVIPLWSLDEVAGNWKRESTCQITSRMVGGVKEQVCSGAVPHFSYWGYAQEIDVYKPGSVGCINTTATAEADACFKVSVLGLFTYRCDAKGEHCQRFDFSSQQFFQRSPDVAWCGVFPIDTATYRVATIYDANSDDCEGDEKPKNGRRSKVTDPVNLTSFKAMLGSDVMLNFTLNGDRDCPTLCAQAALTITAKDLEAAPWTDRDNDGVYSVTDENLKPTIPVDCDDDNPAVHPYAMEPFCVLEDRDCDGLIANKDFKSHTDIPYWRWNWECHVCQGIPDVKLPLTDEAPKNYYDENCDYYYADMDGDGQDWPEDCNDNDKRVHKGATEVLGNWIDEDCDGAAVDADGDGMYNPAHIHLAEALNLDPEKFVDCNDYDRRVNPNAPVSAEAALKPFYYLSGTDVRRRFYYCGLFDQSGEPSYLYYSTVRDFNCDGFATDLDGDGFAAPGDPGLGEGRDTDCDDYDPRVQLPGSALGTCMLPAKLLNDSTCNVPSRAVSDGQCPVLTLAGADVVTRCEEGKDAQGNPTGIGVCSYNGWWDGNPLVVNPGSAWGPCDGDVATNPLPACPEGNTCGGELPYTDAFRTYIEKTYLMSQPIKFKGMCFPSCDLSQ
jgi:hypothetical protein